MPQDIYIAPVQLFFYEEAIIEARKNLAPGMLFATIRLMQEWADTLQVGETVEFIDTNRKEVFGQGAVHFVKKVRIGDLDLNDFVLVRAGGVDCHGPEWVMEKLSRIFKKEVTLQTVVSVICVAKT